MKFLASIVRASRQPPRLNGNVRQGLQHTANPAPLQATYGNTSAAVGKASSPENRPFRTTEDGRNAMTPIPGIDGVTDTTTTAPLKSQSRYFENKPDFTSGSTLSATNRIKSDLSTQEKQQREPHSSDYKHTALSAPAGSKVGKQATYTDNIQEPEPVSTLQTDTENPTSAPDWQAELSRSGQEPFATAIVTPAQAAETDNKPASPTPPNKAGMPDELTRPDTLAVALDAYTNKASNHAARQQTPRPETVHAVHEEAPQVRIGQINVLIDDQAAAKPKRGAASSPAKSNPFGLRGL